MKKHIQNFFSLAIIMVVFGLSFGKLTAQTYCDATPTGKLATPYEYISSVVFGGVSISSGLTSTPYYRDFTTGPILQINRSSNYTITCNISGWYSADKTSIWVDWNQDGTFDNTLYSSGGERYDLSTSSAATGTISVPSNAKGGNVRMRIRMWDGSITSGIDPCGSYYTANNQYGNAHDYTLRVYAPTSITTNLATAVEQRCTSSGNRTLSVVVDGGGLNYDWQRSVNGGSSWTSVQSGTNASYTVPVAADYANWQTITSTPMTKQAQYRCAVTSSFGWGNSTSNIATIQANEPAMAVVPAITGACQGTAGSIAATPNGSYTLLQWQKSVDAVNYTNVVGANSATLSFPSTQLSDRGFYRLVMTNAANCGGSQYISTPSNFQVIELFGITKSPAANVIGCVDKDPVQMTFTHTGTVYSYQWQRSIDNGQTWSNVTGNASATTNSLVFLVPNKNQIGLYRCEMNYATCSGTAIYTSPSISYNVFNSFTINQQPTEQIVCPGTTAVLPVVAVGTVYGYRWKKDGVILTLADNPYAQSAILYLENANFKMSGIYTCEIDAENCANGRDWVASKTVLVYVKRGTEITDIAKEVSAPVGGIARLSVEAHVSNISQTEKARVQWYKGGVALKNDDRIAGAKSSILTIKMINSNDFGDDYSVIVTGLCTSDTAMALSIKEATTPMITLDPVANSSECVGKSTTLMANGTLNVAGNLNYQWRVDGTPIMDGVKYTGTMTQNLTVKNLDAADQSAKFDVVVSTIDGKTTATSNEAMITVKPTATLTTKSNDIISVDVDKEINLSVTMDSPLTLAYQWYVDNGTGTAVEIVGQTTNNLVIANAKTTDAGAYSVSVKSECDDQLINVSEVAVTMANGSTSVERGNLDLNIAPNPTSEILTVKLDGIEYNSINITNTLGEVLFTTNNQSNLLNINVNDLSLSNGIYFINVVGIKNYTGRFVVNK